MLHPPARTLDRILVADRARLDTAADIIARSLKSLGDQGTVMSPAGPSQAATSCNRTLGSRWGELYNPEIVRVGA